MIRRPGNGRRCRACPFLRFVHVHSSVSILPPVMMSPENQTAYGSDRFDKPLTGSDPVETHHSLIDNEGHRPSKAATGVASIGSKISVPSNAGAACRAPQCSHTSRETTRSLRHSGQDTRGWPFLQHQHQNQADPAEDQADEQSADPGGPGKRRSGGPARNSRALLKRRREQDQGDIAGDQSARSPFKPRGSQERNTACSQDNRGSRAGACCVSSALPSAETAIAGPRSRPRSSA